MDSNKKEKVTLPKTGDLILLSDFNNSVMMVTNHKFEINYKHEGTIVYNLLIPDLTYFLYVKNQSGQYSIFFENCLSVLFTKMNKDQKMEITQSKLEWLLKNKKWIIVKKKS